jgi:hypothetical protein
MIEELFCRSAIARPTVEPQVSFNRSINQQLFGLRFKYRIEGAIYNISRHIPGGQKPDQPVPSYRFAAQPRSRKAFGKTPVVDQSQFFQMNDALIDCRIVRRLLPLQPLSEFRFASRPYGQKLQRTGHQLLVIRSG